jgi:nucleotide-binding universal stress UspA family protein
MAVFQTIIHPTDFDEPSKEAFRVARKLASDLGARLVVFHVVAPPAALTEDGKVLAPGNPEPVDLWTEYRRLMVDAPKVHAQYAVMVGDRAEATRLLEEKVRELGEGTLLVMGSHARRGIEWLLWGSKAEDAVRECPCPVLVVKAPPKKPAPDLVAEAATA